MTALEITGLEEALAAGFVTVESLLGRMMPTAEIHHALQGESCD